MDYKVFHGGVRIKKDGEPGEVESTFATLNVIDLDGDVTLPGAFTNGEKVRIAAWGHNWGDLAVGRGEIREKGEKAIMTGRFFLNTTAGKEHYETIKELGELQEWSYGYDVLEAEYGTFEGQEVRFLKKMKVHEVSPVMLGAGIGTQTNDIKGLDKDVVKELADVVTSLKDLVISLAKKGESDSDADGEGDGEGETGAGDGKGKPSIGPSTYAQHIAIELLNLEAEE